jgi:hypothetical protein
MNTGVRFYKELPMPFVFLLCFASTLGSVPIISTKGEITLPVTT